jgi:hypothetical protein
MRARTHTPSHMVHPTHCAVPMPRESVRSLEQQSLSSVPGRSPYLELQILTPTHVLIRHQVRACTVGRAEAWMT